MNDLKGAGLFNAIVGFVFGFLLAKADEICSVIAHAWKNFWAYRRWKKAMKDPDVWKDFV